jgi:voltage-gated potassium channel
MHFRRSLVLSVLALLAIVGGGVGGYMAIEGWTALEALWMVVITLTTIGFGEIHPLSPLGRVFTIGLVLSGLGVGTYTMSRVTVALLEGELAAAIRQRRRERTMKQLHDHHIVVGYGRLGKTIAAELHQSGHQVCIIEENAALVEVARTRYQHVLQGDGGRDDVLLEAGLLRARGLAIATPDPADAVLITLSARQLAPKLPIVTRVTSDEVGVKARRAGATQVVSPHSMAGWRIAHSLIRPHSTGFLDLAMMAEHDGIQIEEMTLPANSPLDGRSLAELMIGQKHGVLVIAIRRPDGTLVPTPPADTRVAEGDVLIVIGAPERVRAFGKRLVPASRKPPAHL